MPILLLLLSFVVLLSATPLAQAALGAAPEDFSVVPTPAATPSSAAMLVVITGDANTAAASYSVQENIMPSGTIVHQYISDGRVFAVTWQGPSMPDLRRLLGDAHFTQYRDAAASSRSGHGHLHVQHTDLVVQSSGRLRAFSGKAYVPQLLPQGVRLEELP